MTRAQSDNGVPNQKIADYYGLIAVADVLVIISEATVIDRPAAKKMLNIPDFFGSEALKGWQNVIESLHSYKGKMGPQIWHVCDMKSQEDYP